jgi:hypothetical protein
MAGRTASAKCAKTRASIASVLASLPVALPKSRTWRGLTACTGSPDAAIRFLTGRTVKNVPDPQPFERALQVLAGTPAVLTTLVTISHENRTDDSQVNAEAWSPRQILAHLLVVERDINPPRLRRLAEEDGWTIEPTGESSAPPIEIDTLLHEWTGERASNLAWLRTLTPDARSHVSIHPRHGAITLDQHVVEWAYHDLDHLRQMLGALGADLYPHMGSWQTLYGQPG